MSLRTLYLEEERQRNEDETAQPFQMHTKYQYQKNSIGKVWWDFISVYLCILCQGMRMVLLVLVLVLVELFTFTIYKTKRWKSREREREKEREHIYSLQIYLREAFPFSYNKCSFLQYHQYLLNVSTLTFIPILAPRLRPHLLALGEFLCV